jgi:hypothetical protein
MAQQAKLPSKSAVKVRSHQLSVETNYKQHENGSSDVMFSLVPGPGTHYFKYQGAWMQVREPSFHVLACTTFQLTLLELPIGQERTGQ